MTQSEPRAQLNCRSQSHRAAALNRTELQRRIAPGYSAESHRATALRSDLRRSLTGNRTALELSARPPHQDPNPLLLVSSPRSRSEIRELASIHVGHHGVYNISLDVAQASSSSSTPAHRLGRKPVGAEKAATANRLNLPQYQQPRTPVRHSVSPATAAAALPRRCRCRGQRGALGR